MSSRARSRRRTTRRLTIVAAIAGLLVAVAAVLHLANTIQKQRLLGSARAEGLAAYAEGNLAEAVEPLALYNARRPGDPEVTLALAASRAHQPQASRDDIRAAANLARTAATLMPGNAEPVLLEIELRQRLGQNTELLDAADRALAILPESNDAASARVLAMVALGRRDAALESALEFAERVPGDPENHRLVLALLTSLDPAATANARVREYVATLERDHADDPRFLILAAQAYVQVREPELAAQTADKLLTPEISEQLDAAALDDATQLLDILGRRQAADALLDRFIQDQPGSAAIASIFIERAYKQGRIALAAQRAAAALASTDDQSPELLMWARLSDVEAAAPAKGYHALIVQGLDALANRDPAAAARHFDLASRERPDSRIAMHLRAIALDRLGNPRDAARLRERLLRLAPDYTIARLAHVQSLLDAGEPDRAAAFARVGLQIEPTSGGLALALALATAERAEHGAPTRAEFEQALDIAQQLDTGASATPASPTHARLLLALGRPNQAARVIDRIIATDGIDAAALLPLAVDARRAGLPAASELLALAELSAANDASSLLAVASAMHNESRTADALALVDRAANAPDADRSIQLARAIFLDRIASPQAADQFAAIFQEAPTDPAALTVILESDAAWTDATLVNAAVTSLQSATADASDAWRFYEARRLLRFGDSEAQAAEAVRLLEPLASAEATSPRVNILLADAFQRLGDANAAINQLGIAADAGTADPALLLRLGWLHHARGDIDAARRRARATLLIEPIEPALRRERVALLATVGLINEADNDANALAETGAPLDLALAASIAARAGDEDALAERLDALEALDNLPPSALTIAGDLMIKTGQVARAFELLERHRPAADTAPFARAEAAILLAAEQAERGTARLVDAFTISGAAADATRAAQLLASRGRTDDALGLIDAALNTAPEDPRLTTLRDAIRLDNAAISGTDADVEPAARTIAAIQRQINNPADTDRLLDDLRWVTTTHPTYYPAWALLTDRLQQLGRVEQAADTANAAMRLMPTDPRPAQLAVGVMLNLEPKTRALGAAREWQLRTRPNTYEPDTTSAALLIRLGRIEEASTLLARWADRIESDPDVPPVLFRLYATTLITSGRADDAGELFARRRDRDDRWIQHQIEIARDLIAFHDAPDLARQWLDRSADLATTNADAALRAAQAAVDLADRTGKPADLAAAIDAADAAIDLATGASRPAASLLLAQAHRLGREPAIARGIAQRIIAENEADPLAWMMLALATLEAQGDPAEARAAAERAIELGGDIAPSLVETLGRCLLAQGDAEAAEQTFRKAISLDADVPGPRVGLAEALAAQGRANDARRVARDPLLKRAADRHALLRIRLEQVANIVQRQSNVADPDRLP